MSKGQLAFTRAAASLGVQLSTQTHLAATTYWFETIVDERHVRVTGHVRPYGFGTKGPDGTLISCDAPFSDGLVMRSGAGLSWLKRNFCTFRTPLVAEGIFFTSHPGFARAWGQSIAARLLPLRNYIISIEDNKAIYASKEIEVNADTLLEKIRQCARFANQGKRVFDEFKTSLRDIASSPQNHFGQGLFDTHSFVHQGEEFDLTFEKQSTFLKAETWKTVIKIKNTSRHSRVAAQEGSRASRKTLNRVLRSDLRSLGRATLVREKESSSLVLRGMNLDSLMIRQALAILIKSIGGTREVGAYR